jgi:putative transposase
MKYRNIFRFQDKYPIGAMCEYFRVSRSGYYGWVKRIEAANKDAALAALIQECHSETRKTYGYRRIRIWLKREKGLIVNHKAILRVMHKTNQLSCVRRRRKWIQYGQKINRHPNVLNRDFSATKPNQKWVTDITYIKTKKDGTLFLSAVKDIYDGSIVAYRMSSVQSQKLVLDTIKAAHRKEKVADGLILPSDQGFQYTSQAYLNLTQHYGISPSMSRAGNPLDNAAMESFFGILKCECLHRVKPATHEEASLLVQDYIHYYNNFRICLKTKLTPYEKRCQSA